MLDSVTLSSCRTCMRNDVNLILLNEALIHEDDTNKILLVQLLMELTAIQVTQNDGKPQNICSDCTKSLENFYAFRQKAINADAHFKMLLDQVKDEVKLENDAEIKFEQDFDYMDTSDHHDAEINECPIELRCDQCDKTFFKEKSYLKHLQTHAPPLHCSYCNKQFQRQTSWAKHLAKHNNTLTIEKAEDNLYTTVVIKSETGEDEYRHLCQQCGKSYDKMSTLSKHLKKHDRDKNKKFTCDTCHKSFGSKSLLRRHLKLHSGTPYKCSKCDKSYSRLDQLKAHMNTHKEIKPNVCPHCNKAFAQVCSLKDHIRTHTKETPYLCSECGKGFANSSNLRQHMLRHTGLKPYKCKLCPKTFCTKGQMTSHMVTHTGAHPYKCEKCGASFTKPNSLKKHAMIHTGQRPFACDSCPMRFTCKDHLKRHNRIHTGEKPYKCKFCARAFTQSNDLVKHMRTHLGQNMYSCSVCSVGFRLQSELKQHYPVHFCSDDPTVKSLLEETERSLLRDRLQNEPEQTLEEKQPVEKFMITINSVDGSNMVAINIEPESSMVKV